MKNFNNFKNKIPIRTSGLKIFLAFLVGFLGINANLIAQVTETFTTPGSITWTVPPGVTSANVVLIGGGGLSNSTANGGGGGLDYVRCNYGFR